MACAERRSDQLTILVMDDTDTRGGTREIDIKLMNNNYTETHTVAHESSALAMINKNGLCLMSHSNTDNFLIIESQVH